MRKILTLLIGIIIFLTSTFAIEVSLNANKSTIDINQPFQITLQIVSDENGNIQIQNIKGLENFQVLGQSQYQSYSSSMVNINGKIKQQIKTTYNVILTLQAKKDGTFQIGPARIKINGKTYQTNTITITVTGTKTPNIMLNGNSPTVQNQTHSISSSFPKQQSNTLNLDKNISTSTKNISTTKNYSILWLTFVLIILGLAILLYLLKSSNKNLKKEKLLETKPEFEDISPDNSKLEENKGDFLTTLAAKYNISNIHSKTYSEILDEIQKQGKKISEEEKQQLEDILINKFKN